MKRPVLKKEMVKSCFESKFLNMYDIQHTEGKHYYNATRKKIEDSVCLLSDEEFANMMPDAINAIVIVRIKGQEPKVYFNHEFRYPVGQFLLNPPAGLIDPADRATDNPLINTAIREIKEETGLEVKATDRIYVVAPGLFSSPGLTDESNAIICAVIDLEDDSSFTQEGAEGSECFDGYIMLDKTQAKEMLMKGRDDNGKFLSVFSYICLMYFVSGMWEE